MTDKLVPVRSNVSAIEKFLLANKEWLNDDHEPAIAYLRTTARKMDEGIASNQAEAQYNQTYRDLLTRLTRLKPVAAQEEAEPSVLAKALANAGVR